MSGEMIQQQFKWLQGRIAEKTQLRCPAAPVCAVYQTRSQYFEPWRASRHEPDVLDATLTRRAHASMRADRNIMHELDVAVWSVLPFVGILLAIRRMGVYLPSGVFRGIRLVTNLSGELKVKIC